MNASATACPRCNGALAPGAQFCGACGSAIGAPAQPPPQAYAPPPPMPSMPHVAARFSGGGGNSKQVNLGCAAPDAFNAAMRVIDGAGAEVHWRQPPQGAKFVLPRKSFWSTLGSTVKFDGDLQVSPAGPSQSSARLSLKLRWGSATPLLLSQVAVVVVAAMFNLYIAYYAIIIIALSVGVTAWTVSSSFPEKILKELGDQIMAQAGGGAPAQPYAPAPQPQAYAVPAAHPPAYGAQPMPPAAAPMSAPAPAAPAAPPAAMDDSAKIMEQIKQLGTLRDAGVLTPAEFEAKKAELLARL